MALSRLSFWPFCQDPARYRSSLATRHDVTGQGPDRPARGTFGSGGTQCRGLAAWLVYGSARCGSRTRLAARPTSRGLACRGLRGSGATTATRLRWLGLGLGLAVGRGARAALGLPGSLLLLVEVAGLELAVHGDGQGDQ